MKKITVTLILFGVLFPQPKSIIDYRNYIIQFYKQKRQNSYYQSKILRQKKYYQPEMILDNYDDISIIKTEDSLEETLDFLELFINDAEMIMGE